MTFRPTPPVTPFSHVEELRDWVQQLERWKEKRIGVPEDLEVLDRLLDQARGWLDRAIARERFVLEQEVEEGELPLRMWRDPDSSTGEGRG